MHLFCKTFQCRLASQAILSEADPRVGVTNHSTQGLAQLPPTGGSWGEQLNAVTPLSYPSEPDAIRLGSGLLGYADMEGKGVSHLPLVKPLLASHLHPTQKSTMTSTGPTLPCKAKCFQLSLTEKGYKVVAMSVRVLNASSMLLACQAKLQDGLSTSPTPALWDELCVVTDLCLHLHRCAVQASGRAMALTVTHVRTRWQYLSSLSQKEKTQLFHVPVDPKGLFGLARR